MERNSKHFHFLFVSLFAASLLFHPALAYPNTLPVEAGAAPETLTLKVTGKNVPASFIYPLLIQNVSENVSLQSDAQYIILFQEDEIPFTSLPAGDSEDLIVPVKFYGAKYKTIKKKIKVTVENIILEETKVPEYLYISNTPEDVRRPRIIFQGEISQQQTVRFLAHHKNAFTETFHFVFLLRNPFNEPVQIRIIRAPAGITQDEIRAGHYTASQFTRAVQAGIGYIREIPPNSFVSLYREDFPPDRTISMMCQISVIEGKGVAFSARILESFLTEEAMAQSVAASNFYRTHGIYPKPFVYLENNFEVGGDWLYIGVGDKPITGLYASDGPLNGNYGVTYEMLVKVTNPSRKKEKVYVYFFPAAGPASGTLLIDEKYTDIQHIKSSEMLKIHTFYILPHEQKYVRIVTLPEPGSFYPVRIVFGARAINNGGQ